MPFSLHLDRLTINDGTVVDCDHRLTVIVGPNNSGKSQLLRDIVAILAGEVSEGIVVRSIDRTTEGSPEEIDGWINTNTAPSRGVGWRERMGLRTVQSLVRSRWLQGGPFEGYVGWFVLHANAEQRLTLANGVDSFDAVTDPPQAPLHYLLPDPNKEARLSAASEEAFGMPVTLNRYAGQRLHLHWGEPETLPPVPTNKEYLDELHTLPLVQSQGDGVRSFLGLLLALISSSYEVVLIDEPEAFLHPPQARLLGDKLVSEAPADAQVFVATHSTDVVRGVIQDPDRDVRIIRLTREGDQTSLSMLEPSDVRELWSDPLLRYSSALDGLFHTGVVVCEADTDCRFYQATLDAALSATDKRPHDLLFTHCGGKHRIPKMLEALHAVGVPVQAVADLDVLNDEQLCEKIIESVGGNWSQFEKDWNLVNSAVVSASGTPLAVSEAAANVAKIFEKTAEKNVTNGLQQQVREALKVEGGWGRLKKVGDAGVPPAEATQAFNRLIDGLAASGLFIVRVGELENWNREIGGHGPQWVAAALDQEFHTTTGPHRDFVLRVAGY